jgi:hypothetical protein
MKVGDLVRFNRVWRKKLHGKVFLVMRTRLGTEPAPNDQEVWIYPDPDADEGYDHTDDDNFYYASGFEVVSESR